MFSNAVTTETAQSTVYRPAPFRPTHARVNLDARYGVQDDPSFDEAKSAECRLRKFIADLPEGTVTQLHTLIVDHALHDMTDAGVECFRAQVGKLQLSFGEDYRFDTLFRQILKRPDETAEAIRDMLRDREMYSDEEVITPGRLIAKPNQLRIHELDGLVYPNVLACINAHFDGSAIPFGQRCLLDVGAGEGRLCARLADLFSSITAVEPNPDRYEYLEERLAYLRSHSAQAAKQRFQTSNEGIRSIIDAAANLGRHNPDVVLLNHTVASLREGGYDFKAFDWALGIVKPGGIVISLMEDPERSPGSLAHFRHYAGVDERVREPQQYFSYMVSKGFCVDAYRMALQLRAHGGKGRHALHELMYYSLPGGEKRQQKGMIQGYTQRFVHEEGGDAAFGLDGRLMMLVARRPNGEAAVPPKLVISSCEVVEPVPAQKKRSPISLGLELAEESFASTHVHVDEHGKTVHTRLNIDELWREYKRPHLPQTRSELLRKVLIKHYDHLVKGCAERIKTKLPDEVDINDLISAGTFGLIDAIDAFELERGVKFSTYAPPRIRGAILDELRSLDWVPRLTRRNSNKLDRGRKELLAALGRDPSDQELARHLDLSTHDFQLMQGDSIPVGVVSLSRKWFETDSNKDVREIDVLVDGTQADPSEVVSSRDFWEWLTKVFDPTEVNILSLQLELGFNLREVGNFVGLSESRISQIRSNIAKRLGSKLLSLPPDQRNTPLIRGLMKFVEGMAPLPANPAPPSNQASANASFGSWNVELTD